MLNVFKIINEDTTMSTLNAIAFVLVSLLLASDKLSILIQHPSQQFKGGSTLFQLCGSTLK